MRSASWHRVWKVSSSRFQYFDTRNELKSVWIWSVLYLDEHGSCCTICGEQMGEQKKQKPWRSLILIESKTNTFCNNMLGEGKRERVREKEWAGKGGRERERKCWHRKWCAYMWDGEGQGRFRNTVTVIILGFSLQGEIWYGKFRY